MLPLTALSSTVKLTIARVIDSSISPLIVIIAVLLEVADPLTSPPIVGPSAK